MVKPQFEVGKDRVGKGGVVRDLGAARRGGAARRRRGGPARLGSARWSPASPLPGPSGNVEFFLWLRRGEAEIGEDEIDPAVHGADEPSVPGERLEP